MLKLNPRERIIFYITVVVLVLFAMDRMVWAPVCQSWQDLNETIAEKRSAIEREQRLLIESDRIRNAYSSLGLARQKDSQSENKQDMTKFLRNIEKLAQRDGVKIQDLKPQTMDSSVLSVSISVQSGWESLVHFVDDIQKSPDMLLVQKAGIHRNGDQGALLTAQFIIAGNLVSDSLNR